MYHQQTQYILVDEHDHWPTAAPPAAAAAAAQQTGLGGHGHGLPPMLPQSAAAADDDDEATESEDEHAARGRRTPALAWHGAAAAAAAAQRGVLDAAPTTAPQRSPTPSASWNAPAAIPRPAGGARGGSGGKGAAKPRRLGGKGGITLRMLIQEGILQPGHNVLSVVSRCWCWMERAVHAFMAPHAPAVPGPAETSPTPLHRSAEPCFCAMPSDKFP